MARRWSTVTSRAYAFFAGHPSILLSRPVQANILIDETCHARVADFSLLTMVPDASSQVSSNSHAQGGTARWMSPELINPKRFGLNKSRPTKPSDCYAFGMVMYETISGHIPFYEDQNHPTIFMQVLDGEHPSRGDDFTDGLWEVMEQCWRPQRDARPEIEDVLLYLESILPPSEPPSVTPSVIDEEVIDFPGMLFHSVPRAEFHVLLPLGPYRSTTTHRMGCLPFWFLDLSRSLC